MHLVDIIIAYYQKTVILLHTYLCLPYSAGIVTFEDKGEHYESLQDSGSTYTLYKSSERMSAIMASTFASIEEQLKGNGGTIEVIDSGDYVNNSKGANE
jgi:hypothetical protein